MDALVSFAMIALALAVAGALGFALGREVGINKGWRDAHEFFSTSIDDTDEAGA